jgi:stage II sporulation protein D
VQERSKSGRVIWVKVKLRNEKMPRFIWGEDFRRALRLRSTLFEIDVSDSEAKNSVQFVGKGFGHGVGMNQTGANVLARSLGWGFSEILHFYYDQIEITWVTSRPSEMSLVLKLE